MGFRGSVDKFFYSEQRFPIGQIPYTLMVRYKAIRENNVRKKGPTNASLIPNRHQALCPGRYTVRNIIVSKHTLLRKVKNGFCPFEK
jgi:hypothetical protein